MRLKPLLSNLVYAVGIEIFVPNKWNFFIYLTTGMLLFSFFTMKKDTQNYIQII